MNNNKHPIINVNSNLNKNTNQINLQSQNTHHTSEIQKLKLNFNLLLDEYSVIEKLFQYFTLLSCPFIKDFPAILLKFSHNGIKAKYGFSLDQQGIMHYGDLEKLEKYPYVIFNFNYKFFTPNQQDENNIIRKSKLCIDLRTNKVTSEILPINHDILSLAVDSSEYTEFIKKIENLKNYIDNSNLNLKIFTEKDEEDNFQNYMELLVIKNRAILRNCLPISIHGLTEPFKNFEKNYLLKIKNFPTQYFIDTILAFIEQIQSEEDIKGQKFIGCIKKTTKNNKNYLAMNMRFRKGFVEFTINPEDIEIFDNNHVQKYFIFRKTFFLSFGRMIKKIKNYENYVIDWEFLRNNIEYDKKEIDYNILNLIVRRVDEIYLEEDNYNNSTTDNKNDIGARIDISSSILYFQYDPVEGDIQNLLDNLE